MYINKIKQLAKLKKVSLEEVAESAEMSKTGFFQALKNGTLRVEALEKIADFLDVHISAFFTTEEPQAPYNVAKKSKKFTQAINSTVGEGECWKQLMEAKDKIIQLQQEILELNKKK